MNETQLASMFIGSADDGDGIDRGRPSDSGNMIHIVNPQTGEILDYITLDNIIDDTHKKSLESYIETYDAIVLGGNNFSYDKHLEKRNHIIIPDEDGTYQEFVLFEVDKYRDTEGRKTHFYAHATYLELKKAKVIYPTRREGLTLSQHAGWALNDTGWTVGIVESEGVRTFNIENHTNPYEFIKRLANEFEVEIRFRVEHDGRRITARYVDFLERIGDCKGREVEFGRDLDEIRRIEKQDIVTALLGLGPERDDGTRIEVLVTDEEALQRWGRVDEHGNLHHLIEPYEIQSDRQEMTEEEARRYTRTALDKRINTQVTYETTILDLEEVPGLEHEKIRFGDTIRIKDTYFNPPLYLEARVYEIERSIKNKAKKDIKLGDYIEYTEEEVNAIWNQLRNEIIRRMNRLAIVSITSTAGNVFKNAQGTTELTARTFVSGAERDEDGTLYDYQWMRFDKDGNHDTSFYAEGKTITVTANDIDEKATYRVLVAYELEVINTAEITISNVFDGEDGEPGPPGEQGPKGEDGQGVDNITIEYYLSDSDSTQTGGTWTETKPTYQPGKYLWIRQKITYKNPTAIEYTTPVLDDSWKAVEIADEAKQEAEEAKQTAQQAQTTADGKNTVFRQSSQPPTSGRKIGDVWFDTSRDNLMHVFNGTQWVEAKWGEQSIVANSITANHIKSLVGLNVNNQFIVDSQGNVKFAGRLQGATGSFSGDLTSEHLKIGPYSPELYWWDTDQPSVIELKNPIRVSDNYYTWGDPFLIRAGNNEVIFIPPLGIIVEGNFLCEHLSTRTIKIISFDTPLWTGQAYPLDTQTIRPSKRLSDCMTGWILRFQRYVVGTGTQDNNFHYIHIPKAHALFKEGAGIRITLGEDTDQTVTKYIYVYNDRIVGHASNNQNRAQNRALTGVFEY